MKEADSMKHGNEVPKTPNSPASVRLENAPIPGSCTTSSEDSSLARSSETPRFSSYTILSEALAGGGYAILNGISGAVDVITTEMGAGLVEGLREARESGKAAAVFDPTSVDALVRSFSPEQVDEFLERGHLTRLSVDEERELASTIAQATQEIQSHDPQFMIVPNLDCNYRCTYCFERPLQKGLHSPKAEISHLRGNVVMSHRHLTALYCAIEELQRKAGHSPGGQIVLYGGEPLDASNQEVVFAIVREGGLRSFVFAVITNGHDLATFFPIIGKGMIEQVQISIDGPKDVHDRRRVHLGHESSFDRILQNVRDGLSRTDAEFQLRVHVDPANIDHFEAVLDVFRNEGWLNHHQVVIYANTVYEKDKHGNVHSRIDNGKIHARLKELVASYQNVYTSAPAVHTRRAFEQVFALGERLQVKGTYCAANTGNYIFAPDGHMYACWESVGKPCSRVGEFLSDSGMTLDESAVKKWFTRSVAAIPECLTCSYALVCGGGCAQYAEYNQGTPLKPYCDDFQRVFSNTLADQVEAFLDLDSTQG